MAIIGVILFGVICYFIKIAFPTTQHRKYYAEQFEGGEDEPSCFEVATDPLAQADPDAIEECCNRIICGQENHDHLTKALPFIMKKAKSPSFNSSDRTRIRNDLKRVYFNVTLDRLIKSYIYECIQDLSTNP